MQVQNWSELPLALRIKPHLMGILSCGEATARRYTHMAGFPSYRVGRQIRISRDGLKRWIEEHEGSVANDG